MPQAADYVSHPGFDRVVIVGGGTAGWMAAAALARFLGAGRRSFTLVESDAIGIVGVGEATIPPIRQFNAMLNISEDEFLRETRGTFKLGIEFVNWGRVGDRYMHPFGPIGRDIRGTPFHQLWLRERARGRPHALEDYSLSTIAARAGRFARASIDQHPALSQLRYAFHFDASLYAGFLRGVAERSGVTRREGRIVKVDRHGESGDVAAVELESGERIEGDLFIDCSGFRGLLIEEALAAGFEDWGHWLPMDRALAMPTANQGPPDAYTRATAHTAGWQWRIPLQHRTGNGHVFSSAWMEQDEAERILRANLEGQALDEPRLIRFQTGVRRETWSHNVVSLGLASGFVEPLESTSIHLIQYGIQRLIALFPDKRISAVEREEYNRGMRAMFESVRDFVMLHYKANQRTDSEFWRAMAAMEVPDSLAERIEMWRVAGRFFPRNDELFLAPSWIAVLLGQNIEPESYDPIVETLPSGDVERFLDSIRADFGQAVERIPAQSDYLRKVGAWAPAGEMA